MLFSDSAGTVAGPFTRVKRGSRFLRVVTLIVDGIC